MDVTVELALEELKHICSQWTLFGHYLQVNNLGAIAERCQGNDEHCLKEVLKDWLKNGKDPSWRRLCSTLEANGWMAEANHIKQKYTVPAGEQVVIVKRKIKHAYVLCSLAVSRTLYASYIYILPIL